MASSAVINVDMQGLKGLAGRCRTASSSLVSDTGLFSEGTNGIEHSGLTAAVNKFEERWSDKRHQIREALDKTATAFVTVADSFEEADRELAKAMAGGGTWASQPKLVYPMDPLATPVAPGVERIDYVPAPVDGGTPS